MLTDHFCDRVEHSVGRVCVCPETRLTVKRKVRMVTHSRSRSRVSRRYEFTVTGGIKSQNSQEQTYVKPNRRDKKRLAKADLNLKMLNNRSLYSLFL